MAFVIMSAGNLAASRVRTVTTGRIAGLGAVLFAVTLAGGVALGMQLGRQFAAPTISTLDAARPGNQALIDRIGSLSARMLRLESKALTLVERFGLTGKAGEAPALPAPVDSRQPSGGPLLAPVDASGVVVPPDVFSGLARLEATLEAIDATIRAVSRSTAIGDLAGMAVPSRYPIPGARISSGFGNRRDPFTQRLARHTGLDLSAARGTPILASAGGKVRFAGYRRAYGNTVEIDHGDGLVTRYAHAGKVLVRSGQLVLPEQSIALVGSTGRSTGPHLHFEVLRNGTFVEPLRYLRPTGG